MRDWFDIPKSPRVKIRVGDAGTITRSFAPASRDVVIRDVFAVDKTPAELTGVDFVRTVDHSLAPGGLYILNCGDDRTLNAARAEAAALLEVFEYVSIVADSAMLKGRRRGNIILAGSHCSASAARKCRGGIYFPRSYGWGSTCPVLGY